MMPEAHAKPEHAHRVSPEEYALFIEGIELQSIWLSSASIHNLRGPEQPGQASFLLESEGDWESQEGGFRAYYESKLELQEIGEPVARIEMTFGLEFTATVPLTDEIFAVFREYNLPVNTWPYLREFVATSLGQ